MTFSCWSMMEVMGTNTTKVVSHLRQLDRRGCRIACYQMVGCGEISTVEMGGKDVVASCWGCINGSAIVWLSTGGHRIASSSLTFFKGNFLLSLSSATSEDTSRGGRESEKGRAKNGSWSVSLGFSSVLVSLSANAHRTCRSSPICSLSRCGVLPPPPTVGHTDRRNATDGPGKGEAGDTFGQGFGRARETRTRFLSRFWIERQSLAERSVQRRV